MYTIEQPFVPTEDLRIDPAYALHVGEAFADRFGVTADPFAATAVYDAQMRALNPRTAKHLVRYELEDSTTDWSADDEQLIMHTANQLGVLAPEYAFDGEETDALMIAEGARTATRDRGIFALEALKDGRLHTRQNVWVIGSDREVKEKEQDLIKNWAPGARTGFDVADAVAERLNDEYAETIRVAGVSLRAFHVEETHPDNRKVVAELIDRRRAAGDTIGSLTVATTALYVPFKTHKGSAVATPRGVELITRGVASRPEIVAARTIDSYLSETATTLRSAAQHQQAMGQ